MKLRKDRTKFIRRADPADTIRAIYGVWMRGSWYRLDRDSSEWIAIEHDGARSLRHRLYIYCPACDRLITVGRFHLHAPDTPGRQKPEERHETEKE